jgi:hypothetical protein
MNQLRCQIRNGHIATKMKEDMNQEFPRILEVHGFR